MMRCAVGGCATWWSPSGTIAESRLGLRQPNRTHASGVLRREARYAHLEGAQRDEAVGLDTTHRSDSTRRSGRICSGAPKTMAGGSRQQRHAPFSIGRRASRLLGMKTAALGG